ncbi:hypothetical protein HCUR_00091 [Holospora curviuscula]|uniref:Uncharacterized protein n=1 Tax=Holospora curviuscula TaxID=1082868 RepID=A0A2S5RHX5_9PROT|nr:hypothetical protein HCUR_00091 [Holospora curviuscula]
MLSLIHEFDISLDCVYKDLNLVNKTVKILFWSQKMRCAFLSFVMYGTICNQDGF